MHHWLDCIQIWYGCSLGISDDLISFWDKSIKNKMADEPFKKTWPVFSTNTNGRSGYIYLAMGMGQTKILSHCRAKKKIPSRMAFLPTANSETIFF